MHEVEKTIISQYGTGSSLSPQPTVNTVSRPPSIDWFNYGADLLIGCRTDSMVLECQDQEGILPWANLGPEVHLWTSVAVNSSNHFYGISNGILYSHQDNPWVIIDAFTPTPTGKLSHVCIDKNDNVYVCFSADESSPDGGGIYQDTQGDNNFNRSDDGVDRKYKGICWHPDGYIIASISSSSGGYLYKKLSGTPTPVLMSEFIYGGVSTVGVSAVGDVYFYIEANSEGVTDQFRGLNVLKGRSPKSILRETGYITAIIGLTSGDILYTCTEYSMYYGAIFRSKDSGKTWFRITPDDNEPWTGIAVQIKTNNTTDNSIDLYPLGYWAEGFRPTKINIGITSRTRQIPGTLKITVYSNVELGTVIGRASFKKANAGIYSADIGNILPQELDISVVSLGMNYGWNVETISFEYLSHDGESESIIKRIIKNINESVGPSNDFDSLYSDMWNIETAKSHGLDVWGRIVNIPRYISVSSVGKVFGFSNGNPDFGTFGESPFRSSIGISNQFPLDDVIYRKLILVKALSNISRLTIPNMNRLLSILFGDRGRAYVLEIGPMEIEMVFEFTLTTTESSIISQSGAIPRPSGVTVNIRQQV